MNLSFGTIVARHRRPRFRHSLVWELPVDQQATNRFEVRGTSTPICWGLLSQPDKQKSASHYRHHHRPLPSTDIALQVEDLLPGTENQLAAGYRYGQGRAKQRRLQV
jgi:hypothetical protein